MYIQHDKTYRFNINIHIDSMYLFIDITKTTESRLMISAYSQSHEVGYELTNELRSNNPKSTSPKCGLKIHFAV